MNSLIDTFMADPLCFAIIITSVLLYFYRTRDLRSLALLGLPFLGEFITLVQNIIVLAMAAVIFTPRTRPLMLLLVATSMLVPLEAQAFVYPIIIMVLMEDFVGGVQPRSYGDGLLGLLLIYGTRDLLKGVDGHLISNYVAIIFSLRMIFFVRNTLQTIKSFYIVLALVSLSLADSELALTFVAAACLLVSLLQLASDHPMVVSFDQDMNSKFYTDPKYFALALSTIALGPLLLLSALIVSSPLYGVCFLIVLSAMAYRSLCLLAQGLIVEGENRQALPLVYPAALFSYSVLVFLLFLRREQFDSWAAIVIAWASVMAAITIGYLALRFSTKDASKTISMLELPGIFLERFQMSVGFVGPAINAGEVTTVAERGQRNQLRELVEDIDFPFVIFTFIILLIGLVLILREAPL